MPRPKAVFRVEGQVGTREGGRRAVFPRGWETRASALGQLGNKTAWNPVLNCVAQTKC